MVFIEENEPTPKEQLEKGLPALTQGNEAQVLFVLLLTMRNIIDNIIYDHPRFYKEAISGPHGDLFKKMLDEIERTDEQVGEYCMFVMRSDNPYQVMNEFNKVLGSIYNIFRKTITMSDLEQVGEQEE